MTKKKTPQTIEESNAELERTQKQLQQYENRNKMLSRTAHPHQVRRAGLYPSA